MGDVMKFTNSIEELYDKEIINNGTNFVCPVCKKKYKKQKTVENHMEKRDCYDIGNLLRGTEYEKDALIVFREVSNTPSFPMSMFRKNRMYKGSLRFVVTCYSWEIKDMGLYYSFIMSETGRDNPSYIFKVSMDEKTVRKYREFLHQNPSKFIGDEFLETHREQLLQDSLFLVRSVEKAHVSMESVMGDPDFCDMIEDVPYEYFERLETIYEKAK